MIVTRIGVGKGALRAIASAALPPLPRRAAQDASVRNIENKLPKRCRVIKPTGAPTIVRSRVYGEHHGRDNQRRRACRPSKTLGLRPNSIFRPPDALLERHLLFNDLIDPSTAGARQTFEAAARSVRDVLRNAGR
jgi:hypothetical protein